MSTLNLRAVGMSHILEGFRTAGLDGQDMLDDLTEAFAFAVAPMSSGRENKSTIDGILIDRKAASWDELRDWIENWARGKGYQYVSWAEDGRVDGSATLHFHR